MQTYNLSTPGTDSRMLTQQSPDSSTVAGLGSNTPKCKTGNQTFPEMNKLKLWHPLSLLGPSCQLNHFLPDVSLLAQKLGSDFVLQRLEL